MAWYYGVNNSELYGSNFSTVLADAPPPLDDTFDEEDNEIVFPSDANKSKKYNGDSRNEKFSDKSKFDGDLTNGKNKSGELDHVEEDSDFGDFAGFADFGSAFEQESNGKSQDWFASNENSVKTASGESANDDEFADFASFGDDKNSQNQEKIANEGLNQGDLMASVLSNHDKNEVSNKGLPSNGSYDIESDDKFGEFASTDLPTVRSEQTFSESDSKSNELQTGNERSSPFEGKTCMEDKVRSDGVSVISEETVGVMSSSDIDDVKTVSHLQEFSASEFSNKFNKETNDGQKEILLCKQVGKVFHPVTKNDKSVQLKSFSAAETQENFEEEEKVDSSLSRKSDEVNNIKNNINDSSTVEHGSGGEEEHENNDSDEDEFGEFSDFSRFSMRPPSLRDDDDDDEKQCNEQLDSPGVSKPAGSQEGTDSSCRKGASVQDENCDVDDKDDFGDFGSFNEKYVQSSIGDTDVPVEDSKQKYSPDDNGVAGVDDDFGNFHSSNSEGRTLPSNNVDNNDFGDFGITDSSTKYSQKDANDDNDLREFGSSDSTGKMFPVEDQDKDEFGDFDHFDSNAEELKKDKDNNDHFAEFGSPTLKGKTSAEDQDNNFDDFGTFRSSAGDSKKADDNCTDEFGDFGNFESSNSKNSQKYEEDDNLGDFSNFESNTKVTQKDDSNDNSFGDFGAFDSTEKDSQEKNESEFGSFGSFEFKVIDASKENDENLSIVVKSTDETGDFRTSDQQPNLNKKEKVNEPNKNYVFGDFSGGNKEASFSASKTLTESPRENIVPKEKSGGSIYFASGQSVIIKQVGDAITLCFTSELKHFSQIQCDVLSMKVKKDFQSELGLWQQLERTDKEGRIPFNWLNSFSQHEKFLSLRIRPHRPPPIQGGSMLKPTVSSQFPPFGGGLAGSVLMPAPPGKSPNSSSGLGFLEPLKGSHLPVHGISQDKTASHHSVYPEMGLPDLSFVLGGGLKRTASKSEFKDTMSDSTSESSSLDLDIFAPSMTQTSDAKSDSKGLYETDLLGLDIFSSSVEPQKVDSPKLQKPSDTNRVWHHGGVTIPLSSQQQRAPLSAAAKTVLNDLEDLSFMSSSVLMFPLKPE